MVNLILNTYLITLILKCKFCCSHFWNKVSFWFASRALYDREYWSDHKDEPVTCGVIQQHSLTNLLFLSFSLQGTVASTASCLQLHKRAERVAAALMGRLNTGDHVALVYPPGMSQAATALHISVIFSPALSSHICTFTVTVTVSRDQRWKWGSQWREYYCIDVMYWRYVFPRRNRPDCYLLWLSVCWLCASHCQTPTPPEPSDHPAHCQDDCWGNGEFAGLFLNDILICPSAQLLLVSLVNVNINIIWKEEEEEKKNVSAKPAVPNEACHIIVLKVSKSVCILTTQTIMKLLKSKDAAAAVDIKSWPMVLDTGWWIPRRADTLMLCFHVATEGIAFRGRT